MFKIKKSAIITVMLIIVISFIETGVFLFNSFISFRETQIAKNEVVINTYYDISDGQIEKFVANSTYKSEETDNTFTLKKTDNQKDSGLIIKQNKEDADILKLNTQLSAGKYLTKENALGIMEVKNENGDYLKNGFSDINDYEMIKDAFHTEFALSMGMNFHIDEKVKRENDTNKTDMAFILDAIENDKTYADVFGVTNSNKVTIFIPDTKLGYDERIIEQFKTILNEGKPISDEAKDDLDKRSKNILEKCERVENEEALIKLYQNSIKEDDYDTIIMMPEFYFLNLQKSKVINLDKEKLFFTHINNNISISYNIYIKNNQNSDENIKIKDFISSIQKNDDFSNETNLRIKNSNFEYSLNGFDEVTKTKNKTSSIENKSRSSLNTVIDSVQIIIAVAGVVAVILASVTMVFAQDERDQMRAKSIIKNVAIIFILASVLCFFFKFV